ncbi:MAG: hypothetical protein J6B27_03375 [Alistipes sp.]|nr:hypothetical protein [Alistipes sp.]
MKKILSILAVAAVAFTACTTDITEDVVKNEGVAYSVPLEFAVEQEVSRAFLGDDLSISFEEGDEVGVYVTPADATAAVTKNAKGTIAKKDGVLTVSVDVASFAAGDKVMAYYPYDAANNNNEATDIILTMPHVQVQSELDKVTLKHMPMVSEATILESASNGSLYFRPVASIIKLNVYSDTADLQGATIANARFHAEKHENVTACNYISGNRSGFDLTSITREGEIEVKKEAVVGGTANKWTITSTPTALQVAYRVNVNCANDIATVGTSKSDAASLYLCIWPGNYGGKKHDSENLSYIQIWTEKGYCKVNVPTTYEFGRGMIRPFSVNLKKDDSFRASVGMEFLYTSAHVSGIVTEQMLNEELIVIGSGAECDNIASTPQTSYNTVGTPDNLRVAYVQTLNGEYGARLEYFTAAKNTLKRGDKIRITLNGTKQFNAAKAYTKDGKTTAATSNVNHIRITNFAPENILELTSGCEDEIVVKEKTLAELTDKDVFTEVTLKNMEMVIKKTVQSGTAKDNNLTSTGYDHNAPFTYGFESNYGGTNVKSSVLPTMMQDKDNNAILALINPQCGNWRRNVGVPQGVGSVKGVLVHETSKAFGDIADGNIGKYQFRPYDETSFSGIPAATEDATKVIAMWNPSKATNSIIYYHFTCAEEGGLGAVQAGGYKLGTTTAGDALYEAGIVPQNKMWATHGELTDGTALLYSSNRVRINKKIYYWYNNATNATITNSTYPIGLLHGLKSRTTKGHATDGNSNSQYTSIIFHSATAGFYEWDANGTWTGKTNGFIVEFPGAKATGKTAVSFSIAPNNGAKHRHHVFGYPLYWKVECSVDGGNTWTACTNAITGNTSGHFDMHMYNLYINNAGYFKPGEDSTQATATSDLNVYYKGISPTGTYAPGGYTQQKFILPESAQGAAKVMVKISPRDTQLAWPASSDYNASLTSTNLHATQTLVHGHAYGVEDVAVTCVK